MHGPRARRRGLRVQGQTVQAVFEDRLDVTIRPRAGGDRPGAGGVEPFGPVLLRQPQDAQARAIALLGMGPALEQGLDERFGVAPDGGAPADQAGGAPLQMRAMRLRHVVRDGRVAAGQIAAHMQPHAHAAQEHVDGRRRQADLDGGVNQRVRDGVIVPVDLDVIIDVDARVTPVGVDVAIARERLQRRPIEPLEERAP